jgi:hypothetical protein
VVVDELLKVGEEGSRRWRRSAPHFPGWSRSRSTAATKEIYGLCNMTTT